MKMLFDQMISLEHMFECWDQFKRGKRKRKDVQQFERYLEDQIFGLHEELKSGHYRHARYEQFLVTDPKQRKISKATVRDRFLHQVLFDTLNALLDPKFLFHSFASRKNKGIHVGVLHLRRMIRSVSCNGKTTCFALKMDIRKFFDSIYHPTLKALLHKNIKDEQILALTNQIINSFCTAQERGIPLGNVTSQLFANVYLHELDCFIKKVCKEKYYLRYCDDFLILSKDETHLQSLISRIREFLTDTLQLELHPRKVTIRKLNQGIDFVGYVLFEHHTLVRTSTKRRMKKKLAETHEDFLIGKSDATTLDQKLQSYLGLLSHANQHELATGLKNAYLMRENDGTKYKKPKA